MPQEQYEGANRSTESGRRLYEIWKRIRRAGCDPVFESYSDFYDWALAVGYMVGDHLHRFDSSIPYTPENCYWSDVTHETISAAWKEEWCKRWNETVNMIRRYFGFSEF